MNKASWSGEIELEVKGESILFLPAKKPRQNWDEEFQKALADDDDELLGGDVQNRFDEEEWEW